MKKKTDPFNTKVGQICKICGFGSNPREISSPMTKLDLQMHLYSHDGEMMCTDCDYYTKSWLLMKLHYMKKHPKVKNPARFFTKEAKNK